MYNPYNNPAGWIFLFLLCRGGDRFRDGVRLPVSVRDQPKIQGFCLFIWGFLGPHLGHMEVPRLGVQSELQLPAYTTATATAMPDPSYVCNLGHSSWQCQILNLLSKARNWAHFLVGFVTTEPQQELRKFSFVPVPQLHSVDSGCCNKIYHRLDSLNNRNLFLTFCRLQDLN